LFYSKKIKITKDEAKYIRIMLKVLKIRYKLVTSEMSNDYIGDIINYNDTKK